MNWFAQYRQDWIQEAVDVFGFINRVHIMRKFGVSQPQASNDLAQFLKDNPGSLVYNVSLKRYEKALE